MAYLCGGLRQSSRFANSTFVVMLLISGASRPPVIIRSVPPETGLNSGSRPEINGFYGKEEV